MPSGDTPAITVRGVTKSFPLGDGRTLPVLDVEHLTFAAGSCTVVKGRSGSGKTTLLNLIAGVSLPTTGAITVHDVNITALPEAERDRHGGEDARDRASFQVAHRDGQVRHRTLSTTGSELGTRLIIAMSRT